MDIKALVEQMIEKVKGDPKLLEKFQSNPTEAVESVLDVDLPDGAADQVIKGVTEKLGGGKVAGIVDKIKGLF